MGSVTSISVASNFGFLVGKFYAEEVVRIWNSE